ncbi:MAG: elongation factor Ts [Gammaproteobacteria bacterium]|nr:elongation factor Ts [Gammaproteobacteria bacterium]
MAITAEMVKELRERTGAGMMECKKALTEANGDMQAAVDGLRKSGMAKAEKRAAKAAAQGLVLIKTSADAKTAVIVEINSETDFVANGDKFKEFAAAVANRIMTSKPANRDVLLSLPLTDTSPVNIADASKALTAQIGEKIDVRRFEILRAKGTLGSYMHGTRIGVVVDIENGDDELRKDVAMHVAASRPLCVNESQVAPEVIAREKEIYLAQAADSAKPADIIEKMTLGRIKKFLKEVTLLGQPFIKNPDQTVEQLVNQAKAKVHHFVRFEVGEGIEKKTEDFAAEVMAQVKKS